MQPYVIKIQIFRAHSFNPNRLKSTWQRIVFDTDCLHQDLAFAEIYRSHLRMPVMRQIYCPIQFQYSNKSQSKK